MAMQVLWSVRDSLVCAPLVACRLACNTNEAQRACSGIALLFVVASADKPIVRCPDVTLK